METTAQTVPLTETAPVNVMMMTSHHEDILESLPSTKTKTQKEITQHVPIIAPRSITATTTYLQPATGMTKCIQSKRSKKKVPSKSTLSCWNEQILSRRSTKMRTAGDSCVLRHTCSMYQKKGSKQILIRSIPWNLRTYVNGFLPFGISQYKTPSRSIPRHKGTGLLACAGLQVFNGNGWLACISLRVIWT